MTDKCGAMDEMSLFKIDSRARNNKRKICVFINRDILYYVPYIIAHAAFDRGYPIVSNSSATV